MKYILGIDQGGTKTAAVLAGYDGNILGCGLAGGACYINSGMDHAMAVIRESCDKAIAMAGVAIGDVDAVAAGLTGADWPEEYVLLREAVQKTVGVANTAVVNDCIIALKAGTSRAYGAIICAGTGLNVGVISPGGECFAFGYYIDAMYQGAEAIGNAAVRAVIAADAGIGRPTRLTEAVLSRLRLENVEALVRAYTSGRLAGDVKYLTPDLMDAASGGDGAAVGIVEDFGAAAAGYAVSGLKRYGMLDMESDVVLSGGVFKSKNRVLLGKITAVIGENCPRAKIIGAVYEPIVGAALLALKNKYGELPPDVLENIKASAARLGLLR